MTKVTNERKSPAGPHRYHPAVASGAVIRPDPGDDGLSGGPWFESRGDGLGAVRSLLAGVVLVMACNGLLRVALGVRAELEDFGLAVTGVVMAGYFLGFLFGTKTAEYFIATVGHIRVFAALASVGSAASILHVIWVDPVSWTVLRFAYGLCLAGLLVTVESWLNDMATNATRGRMLSRYMIVTMGGLGAGQLMLNIADPGSFELFVVSSALISVALVPVALSASTAPPLVVPEPISLRDLVKVAPLGLLTAFWVGVSQGCLMGLGAFYAATEGLSNTRISLFVVSPIVGSVVFQWLVGSASDRMPRRYVILVVAVSAASTAGLHLLVAPGSTLSLLLMFAHGGSTFPLYSLAVATTADSVAPAQLTGASASLVRTSGVGAVIGPTLGGALMAAVALEAFFAVLVGAHGVIALYVVYRMFVKPPPPVEDQGQFDPWPVRASAVAANLLRRPRRDGSDD